MNIAVKSVIAFSIFVLISGCGVSSGGAKFKYSQKIFLPQGLRVEATLSLAKSIGKEVFVLVGKKVKSDPEKFPSDNINIAILWGTIGNLTEGRSKYYINIKGKSKVPIEQNSALKELMMFAINEVNSRVDALQ